jgi:mRNA-degrading endonuclease toxin of MazEF toxin-antitoxin module
MLYKYIVRLVEWCRVNIILVGRPKEIYFKECQIWWCSIGLNIGEEEFGKGPSFQRPVLIFKKLTKNSFLGLPLTGNRKEGSWYTPSEVLGRKGSIMLNQARIFDRRRLKRLIAEMSAADDFEVVKTKFRNFYCSENFITPPLKGEAGIDGKSQIVP